MQKVKYRVLDLALSRFRSFRPAADQDIKAFTGNSFFKALLRLFLSKVRKKICDGENRISIVFTNRELNLFAVLFDDNPVNCERYSDPLIFLYAAILMRIEKSQLAVFI